jgi:hypothetical protein
MIAIIRGGGECCQVKALGAWLDTAGITEGWRFALSARAARFAIGV